MPQLGLAVVADGLGGEAAGEIAAQAAVDCICGVLAGVHVDTTSSGIRMPRRDDALGSLVAAIEHANRVVHLAAEELPAWRGMGTTVAAVLVCCDRAAIAHIGDSRVYRLRGGELTLLTEDHNYYNALVHEGRSHEDLLEGHAMHQHVLTRALGTLPDAEVDARVVDVEPNDLFLLCTDGLHSVVADRELALILTAHPQLEDAAERLVERANEHGGPDNITAVLVRVE